MRGHQTEDDTILSDYPGNALPGHHAPPGDDAPDTAADASATTAATLPVDDAPELYAALCGAEVRFRPLRYDGTGSPAHRPSVAAADTVKDRLRAGWALVAPLAPDLVVLDLDGCARGGLLEALEATAVEHGAMMAYRASSGSPDSEHHAYAVPEDHRGAFRASVAELRERYGADGVGSRRWSLEDRTADQHTGSARAGRGLRLPLSPSLKQHHGPVVWPLDADGCPVLSLRDAARRVQAARQSAGMPPLPVPAALETDEQDTPAPSSTRRRSPAHTAAEAVTRRGVLPPGVGQWTEAEREALETVYPVGRRSDGALKALRVVVKRCGASWSVARPIVMSSPACSKWSARGEDAARAWWEREAARYVEYRETVGAATRSAPGDAEREKVAEWLASSWSPLLNRYGVERAGRAFRCLVHIGQRVMLDGRGTTARRVAVRDLVEFGAVRSVMPASRALHDLEAAGVLERASEYTRDAPLEAVRWSLPGGSDLRRDTDDTVSSHPLVPAVLSPALISDGCAWMPPGLWSAWCWTLTGPLTVTGLSAVSGASVRTARRWVSALEGAALLARSGDGAWSPVLDVVEAAGSCTAPGAAEAVEALEDARARVEVERELWRVVVALRPAAAPRRVSSGAPVDLLESVATAYGGRDGWPDGGEASLFGLEVARSPAARVGPLWAVAG